MKKVLLNQIWCEFVREDHVEIQLSSRPAAARCENLSTRNSTFGKRVIPAKRP